jgi:glucose-6-phosphate isomerase
MSTIKLDLDIPTKSTIDVTSAIDSANESIGVGDERWRLLWQEPMLNEHLDAIQSLVSRLGPKCKNLLLIGIGGSALGARALHTALGKESPNFFVLDNIDPYTVKRTIDSIKSNDPELEHTVVTVVSKSGETAEVTSLLMVVERELQNATFVAITGSTGTLHDLAKSRNWPTLPVPDGVGGRFSVLSPVGLFPAAMCNIDIKALLDGAREMDELCQQKKNNPAGSLAAGLIGSMQEGKHIHVMMPYCDRLFQFANWYVQLWAESLGKFNSNGKRVGPTPVAAIGSTDQHSMLQLWREGPNDKVIGFVTLQETTKVELGDSKISESQSWLCGENLDSILKAQQQATNQSVRDANQPTWTLTFERLDEHSVGQFIALWQDTVAIAGRLLNVNPYNQPGVELGKQLTRDAFIN